MNRRTFLKTSLAATGATVGLTSAAAATPRQNANNKQHAFKLKYAPHFGMFRHHAGDDPVDQLQFMADVGFTALEDNGMMGRSVDEQERIARAMQRLNMTMGVFVAYAEWREPTMVRRSREIRDMLVRHMHSTVETARRVNAKWCTVVPGPSDARLEPGYQTANVVDNLRACAEICEPAGLVLVLEPLNPWRDHPGLFLTKIPQAYEICRAVNSPSCKILNDLYHQQITEGNLIPNMDHAWSEIAYFQVGDNPGRKEPTTGEINYRNVFQHIHNRGFDGIVGMEHGLSKQGRPGEQALLEAYVYCDSF